MSEERCWDVPAPHPAAPNDVWADYWNRRHQIDHAQLAEERKRREDAEHNRTVAVELMGGLTERLEAAEKELAEADEELAEAEEKLAEAVRLLRLEAAESHADHDCLPLGMGPEECRCATAAFLATLEKKEAVP